MGKNFRYQYPDGNTYEVTNVQNMHEINVYTPSSAYAGYFYPIYISSAGNSHWLKGVRVERRLCNIFAIELVTVGSIVFCQDGNEYIVEPDMIFIQRPGCQVVYATGKEGLADKQYVEISGPALKGILAHAALSQCDVCTCSNPGPLARLLKEAASLLSVRPEGYAFRLSTLAYEIILSVAATHGGMQYPAAIQSAISFMDRNLFRSLTIKELAAAACMSEASFYRKFSKHAGETPLNFFQKMKMMHAAEAIHFSSRSIKEIALQYGYSDQAYFCHVFKKVTGTAPSVARSMHRVSNP